MVSRFPFGPEAFHTDEVGRFEGEGLSECIVSSKFYLNAGIRLCREQYQSRLRIVAQEALFLGRGFKLEAFEIGVALVGIEEGGCPHPLGGEFLDAENVGIVVVAGVERGGVEGSVAENDKNLLAAVELAEVLAAAVVVEA